jgi:hypothetical protein
MLVEDSDHLAAADAVAPIAIALPPGSTSRYELAECEKGT